MNVQEVREAIAARLDTIDKLRTSATAQRAAYPPCAWVLLPESIEFDKTYGRGMDTMTLSVLLLVGLANSEHSERAIEAYADGSGPKSIKAAVDGAGSEDEPFDFAVVQSVKFGTYQVAENDYLGAEFEIMVAGQGS